MKKLFFFTMALIITFSGLLSSCTEEEVKTTVPKENESNPHQWD